MKFLRILLLVACLLPTTASSYLDEPMECDLTLQWDNTNPPGTVAGYVVYRRIGVDWLELGKTRKTHYRVSVYVTAATFAVSCYDELGVESPRSDEITVYWPANAARSAPKS